jgi:hypothetical protein
MRPTRDLNPPRNKRKISTVTICRHMQSLKSKKPKGSTSSAKLWGIYGIYFVGTEDEVEIEENTAAWRLVFTLCCAAFDQSHRGNPTKSSPQPNNLPEKYSASTPASQNFLYRLNLIRTGHAEHPGTRQER